MDALVWGTLVDVRLADAPLVRFTGYGPDEWVWEDACPADAIRPALALTVDVRRSFVGDLDGRIEVRMSLDQTWALRPMPRRQTDAGLEWDLHTGSAPLRPGDPIGLPLHRVHSHGVWSLMDESLFGLDADGTIVFQAHPSSWLEPVPDGVAGLTPGALADRLGRCERGLSGAAERRRRFEDAWGAVGNLPPHAYMCGVCAVPIVSTRPDGGCQTDAECGVGEACLDSACRRP